MPHLPHSQVLTRLAPSPIHGVGVFAILPIKRGTRLFEHDNAPMVWIRQTQVAHLRGPVRRLYEDFCIKQKGRLGCPASFNMLTPAWYLNHSDKPNVAIDEELQFYALRAIRPAEELTVDYSTYSDAPVLTRRPRTLRPSRPPRPPA